jgi:hypothetical protein
MASEQGQAQAQAQAEARATGSADPYPGETGRPEGGIMRRAVPVTGAARHRVS